MFLPVIMAGGSGTRLWPVSREHYPKQFCTLVGDGTMLQQTVRRLDGLGCPPPLVICNEEHRFLAAEQLRLSGIENSPIILEPVGRNTAPAITLAALSATHNGEDPLLLVMPADHLITDIPAFHAGLEKAERLARDGRLVTFGIVPGSPETGFGYIRRGGPIGADGFAVAGFEEKPDLDTARAYLDAGDCYWNSGMFMFRAGIYLAEMRKHAPAMLEACEAAMAEPKADAQFIRPDRTAFEACPSDSIDYAVMEKTDRAAVVPLDAGWNDIGSWSAIWDAMDKDADGNALSGDVLQVGSKNSIVAAGKRLVAVVGVDNLVVVETPDAVLVARRDAVQQVKEVVGRLRALDRSEYVNHRKVYRPWGNYDSIDVGERHQVKRITVKPGAKLSVQKHHHRAEHWVVVRGTAKVLKGSETIMLSENESTYIPLGEIHALENPGKIPLELIEVQSGSYLGEDDIVRLEDRYGRV
ncbi:mannose-1-phosphate guanylyltransferase/mannose-6-phosphate isomerase [Nitratireductor sp. ZSWI3]|uniref:mannose-1-phosphate guanylyltransferase/mannose-6-phosphate isomerase n=1 Tax=Nitratireductor sp. ZSWI3 TaxID=2966359 RepID=UPI00214FE5A0|nr:mannose-1-phosphate guanylyltransferase/mannose-6-phosphate isomerase [Nitratireductor sp. ZSWI3]MCR4268273.1 mannose-1-phosphate guanylyltransferase/mannose-6-phosphate isomerase [Nitratireductor sp. ZSWI3]